MIYYHLEYQLRKPQSPQPIDELKKIVKNLVYTTAVFAYFLSRGIYNVKYDRILVELKSMIEEEAQNGVQSSSLNTVLVGDLKTATAFYGDEVNKMIKERKRVNDIECVHKCIDYANGLETIRSQMKAIQKWQGLMFSIYEFRVPT